MLKIGVPIEEALIALVRNSPIEEIKRVLKEEERKADMVAYQSLCIGSGTDGIFTWAEARRNRSEIRRVQALINIGEKMGVAGKDIKKVLMDSLETAIV